MGVGVGLGVGECASECGIEAGFGVDCYATNWQHRQRTLVTTYHPKQETDGEVAAPPSPRQGRPRTKRLNGRHCTAPPPPEGGVRRRCACSDAALKGGTTENKSALADRGSKTMTLAITPRGRRSTLLLSATKHQPVEWFLSRCAARGSA